MKNLTTSLLTLLGWVLNGPTLDKHGCTYIVYLWNFLGCSVVPKFFRVRDNICTFSINYLKVGLLTEVSIDAHGGTVDS